MSKTGGLAYDAMYGVVTAQCKTCMGEGFKVPYLGAAWRTHCTDCKGTGEIKCDTPAKCPFDYCYCEAAYDRQQEQYGKGRSMTDLNQRITEMAREILRDRGLEIDADEWFSTLEGLRQGVALGQESERERCAKVADERDALRSELAELRKPSVASLYGFQAGLGEADDVLDELERLRARVAGLERFVKHDELCSIIGGYGYCNCGLDALLEKDKS